MVKVFSLVVLGALQIGSLHPYANARALPLQKSRRTLEYPSHSCACHCSPDTAVLRIWQKTDGPADRFAVKAIRKWVYALVNYKGVSSAGPPPFARTELLILFGRNLKGVWALEVLETDAGGEIFANLVCTTNEGKRKVLPVIAGFTDWQGIGAVKSGLASRISRRLAKLAKSSEWDPDSLLPVERPLTPKAPALIFRPKRHSSGNWSWTLSAKAKDGRFVRISTSGGPAPEVPFFNGAKWFGGVKDDANGETWWILIKTEESENCLAEWYSIRLPLVATPR